MTYMVFVVLIIAVVLLLYLSIGEYRKKHSTATASVPLAGIKTTWEEKREASRVKVTWPVTIETAEGSLNGETINISASGAFILCQTSPNLKETFRVTITPPNHQALTTTASIVWSNFNVPEDDIVNRGIGIRFLGISEEDRRFISEEVARSSEPA